MPDGELTEIRVAISQIKDSIYELESKVVGLQGRLDQLVASHNQVGENISWLTANTQGIFAMLNDPKFINQMMGGLMGGMMKGGVPNGAAESRTSAGPAAE